MRMISNMGERNGTESDARDGDKSGKGNLVCE